MPIDGDEYTTCDNLLNKSSQFPKTSLFEIIQSGIPSNKVVLGKPATKQDAQQGNMDADVLAGCLGTAKGQGWSGGVMGWAVSYDRLNLPYTSSLMSIYSIQTRTHRGFLLSALNHGQFLRHSILPVQ